MAEFLRASVEREPAVHPDDAPGHERAGLRGEQEEGALELLHAAEAAERHALDQLGARGRVEENAAELGQEIAGRGRADANLMAGKLGRERLGKRDEAALGGGVARQRL